MKTMAFILANLMLFALGVSSATSGPCGTEIDSLSKILAAKDAGSGPTAGAASGTPSAASQSAQHPPTSIMRQQTEGRATSPEDVRRQTEGQPPAAQQGTSGAAARATLQVRQVAHSIVRVCSIGRAKRPNAWKLYKRPSSSSALAETHTAFSGWRS